MLNFIVTILLLPFLPIIMWGNFTHGNSVQNNQPNQIVLGESSENPDLNKSDNNDNIQRSNLFPLEDKQSEFMPTQKPGYKDINLWAGSSVVIDVDSGTILHYDEGRKQTQIASLTKMMTAVLVMENVKDLNEEVTIPKEALLVPGTVVGCPTSVLCTSNRMYTGEKVKVIDLLKVMLLNSANDAATSLGIHVGGTKEKFVDMMNEKAKSLGLVDTHFCTPSGLEIDGQESQCYSSAYDIARIAAYSLHYQMIWDIMKIPEGQFYSCDGKYMHVLKNTDLLINELPNCLGGKTGFTPLAGKSLLLGATDPSRKHKIIAVVLNDEKRWEDMRLLINWVFQNYEWK